MVKLSHVSAVSGRWIAKGVALPLQLISGSASVTIGGQIASVLYAGGAPFLVAGVMQVNAMIPPGLLSGAAEVVSRSARRPPIPSQSGSSEFAGINDPFFSPNNILSLHLCYALLITRPLHSDSGQP